MTTPMVTYELDAEDRIIAVSGRWDEFADENGAVNMTSRDVCRRRIWEFVTGDTTRMWLESLFQYARLLRKNVERPYRCDSPELKRFMRMCVVPQPGGGLRVEHQLLSVEPRTLPVRIECARKAAKNTRPRCSICGRVNSGGWREPLAEHAEESGNILVVYTVCEDCRGLIPGAR